MFMFISRKQKYTYIRIRLINNIKNSEFIKQWTRFFTVHVHFVDKYNTIYNYTGRDL